MLKTIVSAAVASVMLTTSAWALPASAPGTAMESASSAAFQHVAERKVIKKKRVVKKVIRRGPDRRGFRYNAGGRYRNAPNGWHRYNGRPGNWRTRGCIIVGPLWFCP